MFVKRNKNVNLLLALQWVRRDRELRSNELAQNVCVKGGRKYAW